MWHDSFFICMWAYRHTCRKNHDGFERIFVWSTLHHTATHCNALQHNATQCQKISQNSKDTWRVRDVCDMTHFWYVCVTYSRSGDVCRHRFYNVFWMCFGCSCVWHDSFRCMYIWLTHIRWLVRITVCCNMLQCVAVRCSVLQCVAVCRRVSTTVTWRFHVVQCVAVCVAVCCSVLQCVAVCCSVLQCVAVCCSVSKVTRRFYKCDKNKFRYKHVTYRLHIDLCRNRFFFPPWEWEVFGGFMRVTWLRLHIYARLTDSTMTCVGTASTMACFLRAPAIAQLCQPICTKRDLYAPKETYQRDLQPQ